jgi:hypothetical protein
MLLVGVVLTAWAVGVLGVRRERPSRSWVDIALAGPAVGLAVGLVLNYLLPWLGTIAVGGVHLILLGAFIFLWVRGPRR